MTPVLPLKDSEKSARRGDDTEGGRTEKSNAVKIFIG